MILNKENSMKTKQHLDKQLGKLSDKQLVSLAKQAACDPRTAL